MGSRLLAAAVVLATIVSAALLGVMLAAPLIPQPAAIPPPGSVTPAPSDAPEDPLPLGLYLLRGASVYGPCLGLELTPSSYPVDANAGPGTARVYWWERGMTGCESRTGEVQGLEATVEAVPREDAPDETLGYAVGFSLPLAIDVATPVQLTILAARSSQDLLQVVDSGAGGSGEGLVFDLVEAIDPIPDPLPSPTPVAALQPVGLYLLEGPLTADGPCVVLELGEASYPVRPEISSVGSATARWWERGVADPEDPVACLSRAGDVHQVAATVTTIADETGEPTAYLVQFFLPATEARPGQVVAMTVDLDQSTVDQLRATVAGTDEPRAVALDRVDSIDPPPVAP